MSKKAFTMVEAIIVIVLFGIIAGIGAEIIKTMYLNYIQSRTINYLETQSAITLEQIAKRLQYRIKDTTIARRTDNGDIKVLNHQNVNEDYNVIEWISYSNEAMLGTNPGWSGFIDLYNTNTNKAAATLQTTGSNLGNAHDTIDVLSYNSAGLIGGRTSALIFKHKPAGYYDPNNEDGYGWRNGNGDANYILQVSRNNNNNNIFSINGATPNVIYEHYYLAHTAYAITQGDIRSADDFDLVLKYNYQPWAGDSYNDPNTSSAILATNVNLFRIKQVGSTIRLKLCLHDAGKSGMNTFIVACKEEVVF